MRETEAQRVDWEHCPDQSEFLRMLSDLRRLYRAQHALAAVLGVPQMSLKVWQSGRSWSRGAVRAVWLTHCLHFAPWKLRTSFDLITWGKYAVPDPGEKAPN